MIKNCIKIDTMREVKELKDFDVYCIMVWGLAHETIAKTCSVMHIGKKTNVNYKINEKEIKVTNSKKD